MIVKSSSSNKLKPIFFLAGDNLISYVRNVVSQNAVNIRSSSHGIKLRRYKYEENFQCIFVGVNNKGRACLL